MGATRLIAGRHRADGSFTFPVPSGPEAELYDAVELQGEGVLWSYTIQRFRPKLPYDGRGDDLDFVPYGVGYVEFAGALIVEGRITGTDLSGLAIGQPMFVTTEAYRDDGDGQPVVTYAFTATPPERPEV